MKYIGVIIILIIVLGLIYFLPENYYQGLIYLAFIVFSIHRLVKLFLLQWEQKKGILCEGRLVGYKKSDENEILSINYDIDIEFLSPTDDKVYIIKGKQRHKPIDTLYNVVLNSKKPEQSLIRSHLRFEQVFFFLFILIVFGFLFIKAIF